MTKQAVAGIVRYFEDDLDLVLIGLKDNESNGTLSGKWHLPGETLEQGESDKQALKRGMKKEAGIDIMLIGSEEPFATHTTPDGVRVNWYCCYSKSPEIVSDSDVSRVMWVPRKEALDYCSFEAVALMHLKVRDYLFRV